MPGTHTWAAAWYGYSADKPGGSFGNGMSSTMAVGYFTPDAKNPTHGYQVVALPAFNVGTASTSETSEVGTKGGCNGGGSAGGLALLLVLLMPFKNRLSLGREEKGHRDGS
jgi:hypothetical protein